MTKVEFSHEVEFSDKTREVIIYRVFPDGRKHLYTKVDLPLNGDKLAFSNFAKSIGESLLLDSPITREIFNV